MERWKRRFCNRQNASKRGCIIYHSFCVTAGCVFVLIRITVNILFCFLDLCCHHLSFLTGFVASPGQVWACTASPPKVWGMHINTHNHTHKHIHINSASPPIKWRPCKCPTTKLLILERTELSWWGQSCVNSAKEVTVCLLTHLTSSHRQGEGTTFCGTVFCLFFPFAQDRIYLEWRCLVVESSLQLGNGVP